jgi:hypothetical protein
MKLASFCNLNFAKVYIDLEKYVSHQLNSMSDLFIWIYSGGEGVKFMKHFKGGASYESLITSEIMASETTQYIL